MKKVIITMIVTALITFGLTMAGVTIYNTNKEKAYEKLIEEPGIKEIKKVDFTLPTFTITVFGLYDTTITNIDLQKVQTYEIAAVMKSTAGNEYHKYVGVKLTDVFKDRNTIEYNSVVFKAIGDLQVMYEISEITDDMYLVFNVDGKTYPKDEAVTLIDPNHDIRYSLNGVIRLDFA